MHNRIFAVTFDESFAAATGNRTGLFNTMIAVLTAVTIVIGMRLLGALLVSSLIIFPPLTAMRLCRSYKGVEICSVIVSVVCVVTGIIASFICSVPTGAAIVVANLAAFVIFQFIACLRSRVFGR
jgi:zinc transport system permease protein